MVHWQASEASPAGGGGWAGAREACTASPGGRRHPECCPLHRGAVDSFELVGPLACCSIRANFQELAVCLCATALVTSVVDTRPLAPRCALRWGYEAPDSRRSSRLLRGRRWLNLAVLASPGNCVVVQRLVGVDSDVVASEGM